MEIIAFLLRSICFRCFLETSKKNLYAVAVSPPTHYANKINLPHRNTNVALKLPGNNKSLSFYFTINMRYNTCQKEKHKKIMRSPKP